MTRLLIGLLALAGLPAAARRQGFDTWFGLPFSHDMRMTVPRDKGLQTRAFYEPKPEYWDVALVRNGDEIERPVDHPEIVADLVKAAEEHRRTMTPGRPLFDETLAPPAGPR